MSPEYKDEWNISNEDDCEINLPEKNYLETVAEIVYGEKYLWSKKDLIEYNKCFEDIC